MKNHRINRNVLKQGQISPGKWQESMKKSTNSYKKFRNNHKIQIANVKNPEKWNCHCHFVYIFGPLSAIFSVIVIIFIHRYEKCKTTLAYFFSTRGRNVQIVCWLIYKYFRDVYGPQNVYGNATNFVHNSYFVHKLLPASLLE